MADPTPDPALHAPLDDQTTTPPTKDPLRGSRTSGVWVAVIALSVVLILLVIFIAQNTQDVHVSFLSWDGEAPLAVTLMIAAIGGIVITAVAGSLRIFQLRRRVKHTR